MKALPLILAALAVSVPAQAREVFDVARIAVAGGYFDGSKPVGTGSRQRYDGGELGVDVDVVRARGDVGVETHLWFGGVYATSESQAGRAFRFDLAADFPIVRGESFGLLLCAGGGGDFGRHPFAEHGRLYPLLGLRARLWASDATYVQVVAQWLPITSAGVRDHEVRAELGVGIGYLFVGLRGTRTWFATERPARAFVDLGLSGIVGASFL